LTNLRSSECAYSVQPFDATFGKKRTRKRPRLAAEDVADLAARTTAASDQ
jgi:NGP1NT (NUC091) domain